MERYDGKRVTVVGLGLSGEAAARFLLERGAAVLVTDSGAGSEVEKRAAALEAIGARAETGGHHLALAEKTDLVVTSPGVPASNPVLARAGAAGIPAWSEIELAARECPAPVLAVTGTNGKSTVCILLAAMVGASGRRAFPAGNIGTPFCAIAGQAGPGDAVILELSSFQLERTFSLRPRVAVLLNITDDHHDRHPDPASYRAAKARIFLNQGPGDHALANLDDPGARETAAASATGAPLHWYGTAPPVPGDPPAFRLSSAGRLSGPGGEKLATLPPGPGTAPAANVLAAAAAGFLFGLEADALAAGLASFRPLAHRMEIIARAGRVTWINDSKGTNPAAAAFALESLPPGPGRAVVILGGRDKDSDFSLLAGPLESRARAVVLLGESAEKITPFLPPGLPSARARDMAGAVAAAAALTRPGDTVLLSPACASFDLFRDYRHRGEAFRDAVAALGEKARQNSSSQ